MSDNFWRTLGYDPAKKRHLASEWQDLIFKEDLEKSLENFQKHCEDEKHPYDQIVRYLHKNGQTIWLRCRGKAIRDESGRPVRMLGTHTNITDLMYAEELKLLNRKLEHRVEKELECRRAQDQHIYNLQKFSDMSRMMSAIAHHWRQPLNVISLIFQELINQVKEGEVGEETLDELEKSFIENIHSLSSRIDEFQSFFKPESNPVKFEVIFEIIGMLELILAKINLKNIDLTVTCTCEYKDFKCTNFIEHPDCEYHKTQLYGYLSEFKQTMLNLLYNAIESIEERQAGKDDSAGLIRIDITGLDNELVLTVADNGKGIKEENISHIFDPYFTTKDKFDEVGLGLYVVKSFVEQHMKGSVQVKNNDAGGATFRLILPVENCNEEK